MNSVAHSWWFFAHLCVILCFIIFAHLMCDSNLKDLKVSDPSSEANEHIFFLEVPLGIFSFRAACHFSPKVKADYP